MLKKYNQHNLSGLTFVELLIVIAIIGILAIVVLIILNPVEQFSKSRDTSRLSAVDQLGKALENYSLAHNETYPPLVANWQTNVLKSNGDIENIITVPTSPKGTCGGASPANAEGNICYASSLSDAIIWTPAESISYSSLPNCPSGQIPIIMYIESQGKTGLTCLGSINTVPTPDPVNNLYDNIVLSAIGNPTLAPSPTSGNRLSLSPTTSSIVCNPTGVTKNPDGSFTFAQLHVDSSGNIVDQNNCRVSLLGVNQGGLFLGNADGTTDLISLENTMQFFSQNLHSNIVRINYNSYWWNNNSYVPDAHMYFKQWLQTYVKLEEQAGNYIELDTGTQFKNPPCGNDGNGVKITQCASQNQASKNNPPNCTPPEPSNCEQSSYQPPALQAMSDLAKLYANDPAVLFDVWNEPTKAEVSDDIQFMSDMQTRLTTVNQIAPQMMIVIYERAAQLIQGGAQDFTQGQPNIIFDSHIYQSNWDPSQQTAGNVSWGKSHGHDWIIDEWGGVPGQPSPSTLLPFVQSANINSAYFNAADLANPVSKTSPVPSSLNSIGNAVASQYKSIFNLP